MPPKRRSAGTAANTIPSTRAQSTLSFNNRNRVTKQSNILPPSSDKKPTTKRLSDQAKESILDQVSDVKKPEVVEVKDEPEKASAEEQKPTEEEINIAKPRRKTKKPTGYESKMKDAAKLSDAKIRAYWKAEEDSRLAPRVHQKEVHLHEKILRHFDLSSQYGPCIGIARLERWKRASNLGMSPPIEVLAVLLKEESKGMDKGIGGRQCGRLAYIDELASGRVVLVE